MKIYLVRHGVTDSNIKNILMGRGDEPLNGEGLRDVQTFASELPTDFQVLISSPLKRAYQTAEAISQKLNLPIIVREELVERDFGSLEGLSKEEALKVTDGKVDFTQPTIKNVEIDFSPWGGETIEDVRHRVQTFGSYVKENFENKKVFVVSHIGIIRVMYALSGQEIPEHTGNLSMHEIEI